ncbi:MAG: hypothetical protein KAU10_03150, partial [Dehalococcoidia bacterium]|nr:hypothetical protein [Dehalococcoidia bacterium]
GSVTAPGDGTFTYDKGTVLGLVAIPDPGYRFLNWTGDVGTIADATSAETTITMNENHSISAIFKAAYATSDTLVEGLSRPAIHTTDRQGGVYFTEFDPLLDKCRINRFDPVTSETVQLIEHQDAEVRLLSLDGQGDLYYVLRRYVEPPVAQICRLSPGEAESQILFSTEELQQWLLALTVDWSGNVYFALQSGAQSQGLPGSELCRIPAGTTAIETLLVLEDSLQIGNFSMAYDPNSLYFTSTLQEVDRIYRFNSESEALDILLERITEDFGMIPYLATRADGELYYLYRRRSDQADPVQFGYLEIGRFTLEALETCQPPELLLADQLDQAVWVWILSTHSFFTVSNTGDVFFDVILYEEDPVEQAPVGIFWFAPLTGTYLALAEGTIEEVHCFTFVLDDEGNVYYAARTPGTIV